MKSDLQSAARRLSDLVGAPEAVGVLGWGVDGKPRIRVFADENWLRSNTALPKRYAGYRVDVQARVSVCSYQINARVAVTEPAYSSSAHLDE